MKPAVVAQALPSPVASSWRRGIHDVPQSSPDTRIAALGPSCDRPVTLRPWSACANPSLCFPFTTYTSGHHDRLTMTAGKRASFDRNNRAPPLMLTSRLRAD